MVAQGEKEPSRLSDKSAGALATCAQLLQVKEDEMREALISTVAITRNEVIRRELTKEQSLDCRDATAKVSECVCVCV